MAFWRASSVEMLPRLIAGIPAAGKAPDPPPESKKCPLKMFSDPGGRLYGQALGLGGLIRELPQPRRRESFHLPRVFQGECGEIARTDVIQRKYSGDAVPAGVALGYILCSETSIFAAV